MKIFLIAVLCCLSVDVWAAGYCGNIEYAELKDMPKADLVEEYCRVSLTVASLQDVAEHIPNLPLSHGRKIDECLAQKERIGRVVKARIKNLPPCTEAGS